MRIRPSILKKGSAIRKIKLGSISLGDLKFLLPPGFSLRSLAESCCLPFQKGHFPFTQLDSTDFLKEKSLPREVSKWKSELSPGQDISQAEIDAIRKFYEAAAFPNVNAYLEHYLHLDTILLQSGMLELDRLYFDLLGVSFSDSGKETISGLTSFASQMYLFRHKRPSMHMPQNRLLYSVNIKKYCTF